MKIFLSLLSLTLCTLFASAQVTRHPRLPAPAKAALDGRLPGWKFVKVSEDVRQMVKESDSPHADPMFIQGDFNGDGRTDYAALVERGNNHSTRGKLAGAKSYVAVLLNQGQSYKLHLLRAEGDSIRLMKKGTRDFNYETQKEFTYARDAIFMGEGECCGSSCLYENGKFRCFITSD